MKKLFLITIFVILAVNAFACHMAAMMTEAGYNMAWRDSTENTDYDEVYDFIEFCESHSPSTIQSGNYCDDGYGLLYQQENG